jgi:hypothetical protein
MTKENNKTENEARGLSSFHLEADRCRSGLSVMLSGIIGISDFSDEFIYLKGHGGRIAVRGKRLFINVYENESVEIVGRVEGIEFKYGKN